MKGAGGAKEKDLALAVARRVRGIFESRLGIRVLLTRDDDRNVPLDGRTALANNSKADLLISLHANASFNLATTGASILYVLDRDSTSSVPSALGAPAASGALRLPTFSGGARDIDLVPWDLAQQRHVDRSAALAQALEAEFRDRVPMSKHSTDRAPLSVLESANMPAVLIEMGYLTNHDQETAMAGSNFQNLIAQAIFDAVAKFRELPAGGGDR